MTDKRALGLQQILNNSFKLLLNSFMPLFILSVIMYIPDLLKTLLSIPEPKKFSAEGVVFILLNLFCFVLSMPALVTFTNGLWENKRITITESLTYSSQRMFPAFLLILYFFLITLLPILFVTSIVVIGAFFKFAYAIHIAMATLFVSLIYIMIIFDLSCFFVVLDKKSVVESFSISGDLVSGYWRDVLTSYLLMGIFLAVIALIGFLNGKFVHLGDALLNYMAIFISPIIASFCFLFQVGIYRKLKEIKSMPA